MRLTVVGNQMSAAEIHAGSNAARIDFRQDYPSLTYQPCEVPTEVARGVRALLDMFGLRFAALDFLVDPHERWHFVDLNPNGQFGFVLELRAPITRALADLLQGVSS
ncbi:hypothetical protein [Kitasatospora sp. NBC_01266]|uniref:hypothetical protein n=1 Tax=Kitasatospora sp. NBC_01266 TaxID=2903572 RepID=UPI002E2FD61F|nr:hypothetical protein [Kitasatospora sp. NBC_01266]